MERRQPVRFAWPPNELHAGFFGSTSAFSVIAAEARGDNIVPPLLSAKRDGYDVFYGGLRANQDNPEHGHPWHARVMVIGGEITITRDGKAETFRAGDSVILFDCTGGANQRWTFDVGGSIRGVDSGLCLDVTGDRTANGTPVELWTCTGAANQRWVRQ